MTLDEKAAPAVVCKCRCWSFFKRQQYGIISAAMSIVYGRAASRGKINLFWLLFCLACCVDGLPTSGVFAATQIACAAYELHLGTRRTQFDPSQISDLVRLRAQVASFLAERNGSGATALGATKGYWRGLKEINRLIGLMLDPSCPQPRANLINSLLETVAAVNNDLRSPLPERIDGVETLPVLLKSLHVPIGQGHAPAANLQPDNDGQLLEFNSESTRDLSRLDPLPSSFWQRPNNICSEDLFHGFERSRCCSIGEGVCIYAGPKESHGLNPGFSVSCNGQKVKLKFAEVSSEPFAARIFAALGYHVDPTDFAPNLKLRYDRRILQEFNSRKEMNIHFTTFFVLPVYTLKLQKRYEPLDYFSAAVLHDGRVWSRAELRQHLFRDPLASHPEEDGANFRPEVEAQIDYLVTGPANVQPAQPGVKSIGPWDFGQLDHAERRELRGAGLLAAWLGWFDTRFDNTRLRIVQHGTEPQLVHYFSDLGGVLGQTSGFLFSRGELPNAFPWTFTLPPLFQGPHHLARPLRLEGFKPLAATPAFAAMTIDDARWMARLIGQLTEQQIVQALVASGFDSAEVRLYTEKLVSRRDRMIIDLGLQNEIPLLRPTGVNRTFCYDPTRDGPVTTLVPGLGSIAAPTSHLQVLKGKIIRQRPSQ